MITQAFIISELKQTLKKPNLSEQNKRECELLLKFCDLLLLKEKEFNSLSYPVKLKFWEDNEMDYRYIRYNIWKTKRSKVVTISIFPRDLEEQKNYFKWYRSHLEEDRPQKFSIKRVKEDYFFKIKDNPQAIRYTKDLINKYKTAEAGLYKTYSLFRIGFDSVVNNDGIDMKEVFKKPVLAFIDIVLEGIIYAEFVPFLEEQLAILKEEKKKKPKIENEEIEVVPDEIQQRVAWLYAIGVIDYLKEKNKNYSSSNIGNIISKGIGEKSDTIRKTIDRIETEDLLEKFNDWINQTCQKLKIKRVK